MKLYTKTGDSGETSLIGGTRVPKYHLRIEAYGTVDELNAAVGMILALGVPADAGQPLTVIQDRLFVVGSLLAADPVHSKMKLPELSDDDITGLERQIDRLTAVLPALKHFILPGGAPAAAAAHQARCVCRRAERLVVHLSDQEPVDRKIIVYLNRLSDYLFVLSRKLNFDADAPETEWRPG